MRTTAILATLALITSTAIAQVEVIDDPAALDAARQVAAARIDKVVDELFAMIDDEPYYSWNADALVREAPDRTIPRLAAIAGDETRSTEVRLRALRLLSAEHDIARRLLGEEMPGESLALRMLRSDSVEDRKQAIAVYTNRSGMSLSDRERTVMLEMLDDPDPALRGHAVHLCGIHAIPGAGDRFIDILDELPAEQHVRLLFWLARLEHPDALDRLFAATDDDRSPSGLWNLMWSGSEPMRRAATARALSHINALDVDELVKNEDAPPQHVGGSIVRNLAAYGDGRCEDLLLRFVDSPGYAGDAILGLARLGSPDAKGAAIALLETDWPGAPESALQALGRIACGTGDLDVIDALRSYGSRLYRPDGTSHVDDPLRRRALGHRVVRESARVGGEEGRALAGVILARMKARPPSDMVWLLKGWTLRTALAHCVELGILDAMADDAMVREIESESGLRSWGYEVQDFLNVLKREGVSVYVHYESDIPARNDRVLRRFEGGLLDIDAASERWADDSDHDKGYIVQFICNGRLYRFPAQFFGNSLDIRSCVSAVNRALADAGHAVRWQPIGLDVEYMLVTPEKMERFRESFGIQTTTSAANIAAAKAYEERVKALLGGQ